jgi:catechol 2,3-dioxygenase-like lactoylglutathione lyase family enzyme
VDRLVPQLDGVHHLKLPVRDPNRSSQWFQSRLGYASAGFDFFSIGVPTKAALEALPARLTRLGDPDSGVRIASPGWILPGLSDPDGHEIRFYTTESHQKAPEGQAYIVDNARPAGKHAGMEGSP